MDASFSIQPGERCAFVGRNGSGKTSLFRMLTGKESPDKGTIAKRKNYTIGILDQHIVFTKHTLIEEAALGLRPEEQDCIYKAETILFGLGFKEEDSRTNPAGVLRWLSAETASCKGSCGRAGLFASR